MAKNNGIGKGVFVLAAGLAQSIVTAILAVFVPASAHADWYQPVNLTAPGMAIIAEGVVSTFGSVFGATGQSAGNTVAQTAVNTSDDFVTLYHQGNLPGGQVSATLPLLTSPSSNLLHYNPAGQLYQFQVPQQTYMQWLNQGYVQPLTDLHAPTGIITPEIRVLPPASGEMNRYLFNP